MEGEKGLECEVYVERIRLDCVSKFLYLGCVLDKLGRDGAECSRKVTLSIRSLVNARDLQHECASLA